MENEMLQQILTELKEMRGDVTELKSDMRDVKRELGTVKSSVLKTELVEYPRIQAALDGLAGAIDRNAVQDTRLKVLEDKAERHDFEIKKLAKAAQ